MHSRIEDYALIGDCEAAALLGRNGSLDWLRRQCSPKRAPRSLLGRVRDVRAMAVRARRCSMLLENVRPMNRDRYPKSPEKALDGAPGAPRAASRAHAQSKWRPFRGRTG